ncbi:MAG: hypothetical protein PHQ89_02360 [Bacilli bacterium]|nr:hypothetical protein [Bacilli bacterium]
MTGNTKKLPGVTGIKIIYKDDLPSMIEITFNNGKKMEEPYSKEVIAVLLKESYLTKKDIKEEHIKEISSIKLEPLPLPTLEKEAEPVIEEKPKEDKTFTIKKKKYSLKKMFNNNKVILAYILGVSVTTSMAVGIAHYNSNNAINTNINTPIPTAIESQMVSDEEAVEATMAPTAEPTPEATVMAEERALTASDVDNFVNNFKEQNPNTKVSDKSLQYICLLANGYNPGAIDLEADVLDPLDDILEDPSSVINSETLFIENNKDKSFASSFIEQRKTLLAKELAADPSLTEQAKQFTELGQTLFVNDKTEYDSLSNEMVKTIALTTYLKTADNRYLSPDDIKSMIKSNSAAKVTLESQIYQDLLKEPTAELQTYALTNTLKK